MIQQSILDELDDDDGKYKLFIENPQTPQDHFMNDIFISLQQMQAGDVVDDFDECLRQLREELGLDENGRHPDTALPIAAKETFA